MSNDNEGIKMFIFIVCLLFILVFGAANLIINISEDEVSFCKEICISKNMSYERLYNRNCFCKDNNGEIIQTTNIIKNRGN